jgi:hypothetical protein
MCDPVISIFHPTARPYEWAKACRRFQLLADNPERCEYVLGIHRRQSEIPGYEGIKFTQYYQVCAALLSEMWPLNWRVSVNIGSPNVVQNTNAAGACTSGKLLIGVGDYLRPFPHWDTELLKAVPDLDKPYLLRTSHGDYLPGTWIVTYGIFTRALYEKYGYIAWPEYTHYGVDDDLTLMADRDGLILDATHLNFPYIHWSNGLRSPDLIDKLKQDSGAWKIKEEVLKRRKASNFSGKVVLGCVAVSESVAGE